MDLSTTYLGLKLPSPLVASASPLSRDVDGICRLEDAGASAVVLAAAIFVCILVWPGARAFGQASDPDLRPTRGPFITGATRAGLGDATDTELNPAALALTSTALLRSGLSVP